MASEVCNYKRLTQQIVPFNLFNDNQIKLRYYNEQILATKIIKVGRTSVLDPQNDFSSFDSESLVTQES